VFVKTAINFLSANNIYTVNHKKHILFLTITLANLDRFFFTFYIILIVKKFGM